MAGSEDEELRIVVEFQERYWLDRERGEGRSLAGYLALFPGHEAVIIREFQALEDDLTQVATHPEAVRAGMDVIAPGGRFGPYVLLQEIGSGGQGVVWTAEDTRLRRRVALKLLSLVPGAGCDEVLARFQREAEVASRLQHPGICAVHEAGRERGVSYIAMQLVPGESLAARLKRPRPETPASVSRSEALAAARFVEAAARAVHAAHERGIVHRDLKPGNIMVAPGEDPTTGSPGGAATGASAEDERAWGPCAGERPVILDFGLARDEESTVQTLTRTGDFFGTPAYMAPEQVRGERADRRADVWALGVTLYEMLARRPPFGGPTRDTLLRAITSEEPRRLRGLNPAVPRDLETVVLTALEKDLGRRYRTALDFAEDLRRVAALEPILARPPSVAARLIRWVRREPLRAGLAGLFLVAVGLGTFLVARWPEIERGREEARRLRVESELSQAYLSLSADDDATALARFEQALQIDPGSAEAAAGVALAHLAGGRPEAALRFVTARKATSPVALAWLEAEALRRVGRSAEADALEAGLPRPDTAFACYVLGIREYERGRTLSEDAFPAALEWLQEAVLRSPRPRQIYHCALADAAFWNDDRAAALRVARVLPELWPDSADCFYWAAIAVSNKEPDLAVATCERMAQRWPEYGRTWNVLGIAKKRKGDLDGAIAAYEEAVRRQPRYHAAWYNLGLARWDKEDAAGAVLAFREALGLGRKDARTLRHLGEALIETGDLDEAATLLREAVDLDPKWSGAWFQLGRALYRKDDDAGAVEAYRRSLETDPDDPTTWNNLALALLDHGDREEARRVAERTIALDPQYARGHDTLGDVHRKGGDLEKAAACYREALRLDPKLAWSQEALGLCLEGLGDPKGAAAAYEAALAVDPSLAEAKKRLAALRSVR